MRFNNVLETIGNTPLIRINNLFPKEYEVYVKMEKANPGGSIKDRIALSMVEDAEKKGFLKPDTLIV
ncbi:MAG: pyridoxal-phosphate dependent enzyme, partial [Prolixibacteraceae bacterium]